MGQTQPQFKQFQAAQDHIHYMEGLNRLLELDKEK
jgi:hypothetical protein